MRADPGGVQWSPRSPRGGSGSHGRERPHGPGAEPVQRPWPDPTWYGCGPASDDGLGLESHVGGDRGTLVASDPRRAGDEPTATGEVVAVRVHPPDAEGVDGIHRPRSESGSRSESESESEPGP